MAISQTPELLAEVLNNETIPIQKQAYFRRRLRLRLYEIVVGKFHQLETMSKADLARRIGRRPEVINRLLGAPGNWTLDTVSDLLLGMSSELELSINSLSSKAEPALPEDYATSVIKAQRPFDYGQDADPGKTLERLSVPKPVTA
jgi:hypothetical protein